MKVVVSKCRINSNAQLPPGSGFGVPYPPITGLITSVGNITGDRYEGGVHLGYSLDQRSAHHRICGFGVSRIGEARVAVGDKLKRHFSVTSQLDRLRGEGVGNT